jgi:hypothetical protein
MNGQCASLVSGCRAMAHASEAQWRYYRHSLGSSLVQKLIYNLETLVGEKARIQALRGLGHRSNAA